MELEFGAIELLPTERSAVELEILRKVRTSNRREAEDIFNDFRMECRQIDNIIRVEAGFKDGWRPLNNPGNILGLHKDGCYLTYFDKLAEHHFLISLPRRFNVNLKTRCGRIDVGNLKGSVDVWTSTGAIKLGEIDGQIRAVTYAGGIDLKWGGAGAELRTNGGHIRVGEVTDNLTAKTLGGSIEILKAGGQVKATTLGGNIMVQDGRDAVEAETGGGSIIVRISRQPHAAGRLAATNGAVTVYLAEAVGVNLEAYAPDDQVDSEIKIDGRHYSPAKKISGSINGGGPHLLIRSSRYGISLRKGVSRE